MYHFHEYKYKPGYSHQYDLIVVCASLRVLDVGGDSVIYAELGRDISLPCRYELEEEVLYSIKWYRDDREFFRYIPTGETEEMHTSKGFRRSWQILYYLLYKSATQQQSVFIQQTRDSAIK